MGVWSTIARDIKSRRHLDAYTAIALGLGVFVLTVFGVLRTDIVAAGVLLVTSFCVWEILASRHDLASIRELLRRRRTANVVTRGFHPAPREIGEYLRHAKQIDLCGVSLFRLIPVTYTNIAEALSKGAKLRVIVSDPESAAAEMASLRSPDPVTPADERHRIRTTLASLARLMKDYPNQEIEVRTCPILFPYSIVSIVPADQAEPPYCHAAVSAFRSPAVEAPFFLPDPIREREWYNYFITQFKSLWEASSPITTRSTPEVVAQS
jgi:hypothetical protein